VPSWRNWLTAVEEIALIGHSMGGLIAGRGCHRVRQAGASWVPAVRHTVCSPHLGAPVEKGVAVLSRALAGVAEIRPFAFLRNERGAGINTSVSYLTQDDWRDCDPDSCGVDHRSSSSRTSATMSSPPLPLAILPIRLAA
jgi:alpha-beta hydrolase superfamily lysophospholipase